MSHSEARICATHKIIQRQCRCPEPITSVIEEDCKHSFPITDQMVFWNGQRTVRGTQDEAIFLAALDAEIVRLHGPEALGAINAALADGSIYGDSEPYQPKHARP